jgi:hypothetical protein
VAIHADTNNDGFISAAEKGTATTTSVSAQLDKTKVVAGDVVTFSDGTNTQTVTLKDTDITNGQVTTSAWKIPGEGLALTITAVLRDLAGNLSVAVNDMVTTAIDSLKTALTIHPISTDNIITIPLVSDCGSWDLPLGSRLRPKPTPSLTSPCSTHPQPLSAKLLNR